MNKVASSTLAILLAFNPLCALAEQQQRPDVIQKTHQLMSGFAQEVRSHAQEIKEYCSIYPTVEQEWQKVKANAQRELAREGIEQEATEMHLIPMLYELLANLHLQMIEEQCALGEDITAINQVPAKYAEEMTRLENILSWIGDPSFNDFMLGLEVIMSEKDSSVYNQMNKIKEMSESFLKTEKLYPGEGKFYTLWLTYAETEIAFIDRVYQSDNLNEINNVIAKQYGPKLDKLSNLLRVYRNELEMHQNNG